MQLKRFYFPILFTFLASFYSNRIHAQKPAVLNLPKYDVEWLHFGFSLGVNSTDFIIHPVKDFYTFDSLKTVESEPQLGFNLGIISDLRINDYFHLRFIPDLSFAQRNLAYHFEGSDVITRVKKVESTFLNFPINIKLQSERVNNGGAYMLAGAKYTFDLASQKGVKNDVPGQEIVKLRKNDFSYELGAGIQFYLPYFKFAIETKLSVGIKDLLIRDNTIYSQSVDKLNSKVILIAFTFEG